METNEHDLSALSVLAEQAGVLIANVADTMGVDIAALKLTLILADGEELEYDAEFEKETETVEEDGAE